VTVLTNPSPKGAFLRPLDKQASLKPQPQSRYRPCEPSLEKVVAEAGPFRLVRLRRPGPRFRQGV
jgi:hypothetical protein